MITACAFAISKDDKESRDQEIKKKTQWKEKKDSVGKRQSIAIHKTNLDARPKTS